MTITLSPNQSDIQTVFRSFLLSILPSGIEIFQGQDNRVPEPAADDFVVFTVIGHDRLETNFDNPADVSFTGSIRGSVLSVSAVQFGTIGTAGATLFGPGIITGTQIVGQLTGTLGGVGTYQVTGTQTVSNETMASGAISITQNTKIRMQIDVHGPASSDNAQTISTVFRDDVACQFFTVSGIDMQPLHADDPKQIPFQNAEMQWEYRWVIDAELQANQVVSGIPQQFFTAAVLQLDPVIP